MSASIKVTTEISLQRISDLLCDAFEGGSNYWYFIKGKVKPPNLDFRSDENQIFWHMDYPLNEGGELTITILEEEDFRDFKGKEYKLNLDTIQKGLSIMQEKYPRHFGDFMKENDDAITGDVFLQCCLFGEVIFG